MKVQSPINLNRWVEENRHLFKPPVANRYLYDGRDFFVMVIAGPNARNDFHLVDSEEYFYQVKGDIKVRCREGDKIVDHIVREGETGYVARNLDDFVKYSIELIDDREKLERMKQMSLDFALTRSWDSVFEGVYKTYREARDYLADVRRQQRAAMEADSRA